MPVALGQGGPQYDVAVANAFKSVSAICPRATAELSALHLQAQCLLLDAAKALCVNCIQQDLLTAQRVLDERGPEAVAVVEELLQARVNSTTRYVVQHAETRAIRQYVRGLFASTAISIAVLGLLGFAAPVLWSLMFGEISADGVMHLYQGLVAVGGGVAGAVVSVLVRDCAGIAEADDDSLMRAARIRVALGWFFGAAVVFLLKGQVVDIVKMPTTSDVMTQWFFWGAVGFLAGFNERWVRQLISRDTSRADQPATSPAIVK